MARSERTLSRTVCKNEYKEKIKILPGETLDIIAIDIFEISSIENKVFTRRQK